MIAVFDIDGVLADASHRQHFVEARPKDWSAFFAAVGEDAVIDSGRALLHEYQERGEVVLVSGRPESTRQDTREWLERHDIRVDRLILRRGSDYRPASVAKAELVQSLGDSTQIAIVVDDDERVIESLAGLGYQVRLFR